jgi:bleomycin hydrolase
VKPVFLTLFSLCILPSVFAQTTTNKPNSTYQFEKIADLDKTNVKDQCKTATCWSYSTLSLLESELIKNGKGQVDLSEMFIARNAYIEKAINYIRLNGKHQFDQGGEGHDILYMIDKYGIVPESVYSGLLNNKKRHDHTELVLVLKSFLDGLLKVPNAEYGNEWKIAFEGILDSYLGKIPTEFNYNGKMYNPKTFAASLEINTDDYIVLTSFTHHPFYKKPFAIEVPDNWAMQTAYNIPLNELSETVNGALKEGFTVAWATDVSEKGFSHRDGLAIVPIHDSLITKKGEDSKQFNSAGAEKISTVFNTPCQELIITQDLRQAAFDSQKTTDDHGMHITGLYQEKSGTYYYKVKNSWGTTNALEGYLFASNSYFQYKTISVMLNKKAIPQKISKKLFQ